MMFSRKALKEKLIESSDLATNLIHFDEKQNKEMKRAL